jgi:hypothetical protein
MGRVAAAAPIFRDLTCLEIELAMEVITPWALSFILTSRFCARAAHASLACHNRPPEHSGSLAPHVAGLKAARRFMAMG